MKEREFKKLIEQKILQETQYKGKECQKCISASEIASEPLQVWLRQKHGVIPKESIGQDTIGSLVHLGIEKVFENDESFETEINLETRIGDWKLTGTIDIFSKEHKIVADVKSTKLNTYLKFDENHQYAWQLNAYRYLVEKNYGFTPNMFLIFFFKDGGWDYKKREIKQDFTVGVVPYIDNETIEQKVKELAKTINLGMEPPQCKELWFAKNKQGNSFPTRCEFYCSYKNVCPYYKRDQRKKIGDLI